MLSITNITHYIGGKELYQNTSLQIQEKDKVALIGLNGTGKSTLFKIITEQIDLEQGQIEKNKNCSIGYLDQDHLSYDEGASILSIAMQAFPETKTLQKKIEEVLHQMEVNYSDNLPDLLADLQDQFEKQGGYQVEYKTKKVLEGIGFETADLGRPISEFSGGWRMRVILAKLLLEAPTLLMLDEPTNHLDIESIKWLEGYLKNYPHAVMLISHDKYFLNSCTNKTIAIAQKHFQTYAGNYNFYEQEKAKQEEIQQQAYVNQQKSLQQQQRFIDRFRSKASKAKQVQSKIKALEKMDKIESVASEAPKVHINFGAPPRAGKQVLEIKDLSFGYKDSLIFSNAEATVTRGQKIGLIGINGKGKTTLLELIAQHKKAQTGTITLGHNVKFAFYAQHQLEALNLNNTILKELEQASTYQSHEELRKLLGTFLFKKEEVYKKIKVLSGGEKARVSLAKTLIEEANFLLLDEPTNHLDMPTISLLVEALKKFPGTILFVSHNREFIAGLADTIWYIENQKIKSYPGNYAQYTDWQKHKK